MLKLLGKYAVALLVAGMWGGLGACTSSPMSMERHTISATVVYADLDTINLAARGRGYNKKVRVRGFYDPVRNEIWCPNDETPDALRTCGHELRHLTKGLFH